MNDADTAAAAAADRAVTEVLETRCNRPQVSSAALTGNSHTEAATPASVAATPDIASYVEAILSLYLAFALAFQVPIVVILLVKLGWVSVAKLKDFRGYFIVLSFVVAAIVTPPDVISQLSLAIPMCLLYEAGIWAAQWLVKPKQVVSEDSDTE